LDPDWKKLKRGGQPQVSSSIKHAVKKLEIFRTRKLHRCRQILVRSFSLRSPAALAPTEDSGANEGDDTPTPLKKTRKNRGIQTFEIVKASLSAARETVRSPLVKKVNKILVIILKRVFAFSKP